MSNHSAISHISRQFSPDQIRSWALQWGVPENAVLLVVKGFIPAAWLLWEKRYLRHWTDETTSSMMESQLSLIFHQNPAIFPALSAFSGASLSKLKQLLPSVIHALSGIMWAQFQEKTPSELSKWFQLENDNVRVLLPATIRVVTPELQETKPSVSPSNSLSAWIVGLFWLVLLGFLYYLLL